MRLLLVLPLAWAGCNMIASHVAPESPWDASVDGPIPDLLVPSEVGPIDGAPEAPDLWAPRLQCELPIEVGSGQNGNLSEPAVSVDGTYLVARDGTHFYQASRDTPETFGAWSAYGSEVYNVADVTFFTAPDGTVAIIASTKGKPRTLLFCGGADVAACTPLSISGIPGAELDLDGTTIRPIGGELVMVLNAEPYPTANEQRVYRALPSDAADPSKPWIADPTPLLVRPGTGEDDPTISADGLLIVFSDPLEGAVNPSQLYASFAESPGAPFSAPRPVEGLDPTVIHGAPELSPAPPSAGEDARELFFAGRYGQRYVYRTVCRAR